MTYSPVKWDSEIIPDNYGIEYIDFGINKENKLRSIIF